MGQREGGRPRRGGARSRQRAVTNGQRRTRRTRRATVSRRVCEFCVDRRSAVREPRERVAGEAVDGPVVHRPRAKAAVESNRRLVPVQHRPFHAAAVRARQRPARGARAARDPPRGRATPARRTNLRDTGRVFRGTSSSCGTTRAKPTGSAPARAITTSAAGAGPKQRRPQAGFVSHHIAGHPFVLGERLDERQDRRHVALGRGIDPHVRREGSPASSERRRGNRWRVNPVPPQDEQPHRHRRPRDSPRVRGWRSERARKIDNAEETRPATRGRRSRSDRAPPSPGNTGRSRQRK